MPPGSAAVVVGHVKFCNDEKQLSIQHLHSTPPVILIVYSKLDRGMKSATKMLPFLEKEARMLHVVLTARPRMASIVFY